MTRKYRNGHVAIDLGEAVVSRKRGTERMFKLRTMYLHGLNGKADTCEDDKKARRFKSNDRYVGRLVSSLPIIFQKH